MRILGIDPGTATTGYGVVEEDPQGQLFSVAYGTINTPANMAVEKRLLSIFEELKKLILLYEPQSAAVEKLFFYQNVTTAMAVRQARGVVVLSHCPGRITIWRIHTSGSETGSDRLWQSG